MAAFFIGGRMNVSNFRTKLRKGNVPDKESFELDGLFNTYFFDTGQDKKAKEILEPSYAIAFCENDISEEKELFLSLGINSCLDGVNKRWKKLNLVVCLDISGSMGWGFDADSWRYSGEEGGEKQKTKMEVARNVLLELVQILDKDERLGIVLFDDKVEILQPVRLLSDIDVDELMEEIRGVRSRGGTNMEIGMKASIEMLEDVMSDEEGTKDMNNQIIFLTDAQPNVGGGKNTLVNMSMKAGKKGIFTTFIGVGLDFNDRLTNELTKVRGSNSMTVQDAKEFKKILIEDFNYIVSPIAFDTHLFFECEGLVLDKVFNSPFSDEASGCLMKVETVSPSPRDERGVKGGVVLIRLKEKLTPKEKPSMIATLTLCFENVDGSKSKIQKKIDMGAILERMKNPDNKEEFPNIGIRKAVCLAKYATFIREMIENINNRIDMHSDEMKVFNEGEMSEGGGKKPELKKVSEEMKEDLKSLKKWFKAEVQAIGDKQLNKELDVIDRFLYM